ncbi:MAG: hypothetical protein RR234_06475 [Christensenella sp.]
MTYESLSVHYYKWIDIDCQDAPDTCEYSAFSLGKPTQPNLEKQNTSQRRQAKLVVLKVHTKGLPVRAANANVCCKQFE